MFGAGYLLGSMPGTGNSAETRGGLHQRITSRKMRRGRRGFINHLGIVMQTSFLGESLLRQPFIFWK
jgi:hypothetical protein